MAVDSGKNKKKVKKSTERQKSNPLSDETRIKIIQQYEKQKTPFRDLAKEHKVSASQIQRIMAKKNKYLNKSDSQQSGLNIVSADSSDAVDVINRMLLEKDLTEDSNNEDEDDSNDENMDIWMADDIDSANNSQTSAGQDIGNKEIVLASDANANDILATISPESVYQIGKNNDEMDGRSLNGSEYATSVSSAFSDDSIEDFKLEPSDPNEKKSSSRLFIEQCCTFVQNKKQQRAKWMAQNKKLKRRLKSYKKKAQKFENIVNDMIKKKMVHCTKCGEMKPKLTFDFCSFKCLQGALSPNS